MKKLLLNLLIGFTGLYLQAQIAPGSDAPDFTVTDINGNVHTLSNYLAQGKTVIIDISATWCGPCWNYHESGALEKLYYTYGPGGSDEVVVLFIEGDSLTSVESLYGTNMPGDSGVTQGDWTEHSPYPIIDSSLLSQLYQINYFPSIFRICPDGKVSEIAQLNFEDLRQNIIDNCSNLTDLQNHGKVLISDYKVCEGSSTIPKVTLTNYGTANINNAVIELRQDTQLLASETYNGSLEMFDEVVITFDEAVFTPSDYNVIITDINGSTPINTLVTEDSFEVIESSEASNNITVNVYTNSFPDKISWAIKNSSGSYVASGGPYQEGDADTTKIHNVTLSATDTECYSVEFYSTNGYGWDGGDTPHGIEILSGGETVFSQFVESFGFVLEVPHAFKSNGMLGILDINQNDVLLYPNPTNGQITVVSTEPSLITLYDMTGKQVFEKKLGQEETQLNLSSLSKGVYIAKFKGETTNTIKKIIVE